MYQNKVFALNAMNPHLEPLLPLLIESLLVALPQRAVESLEDGRVPAEVGVELHGGDVAGADVGQGGAHVAVAVDEPVGCMVEAF